MRRTAGEWRRLVAMQKRSDLSVSEFADGRGLSPQTLSWWRWHLSSRRVASASDVRLVPVQVEQPSTSAAWPAFGGELTLLKARKAKIVLRGLLLGTLVTLASSLSTGFRDVPSFFAGVVYGPIIDAVAS